LKYTHPKYNLIINANGGYRVLEKLGFKPEQDEEKTKKKEEQKEKFKQFIASHPLIDKICPICNQPFQTRNPKVRTNTRKCGQQLRRKEGR